MAIHLAKATFPLRGRVVAFLGLFVLVSGLIGPRVISGQLLYRDGFWIYGSLGKAAVFGLIALVLLVGHRKTAFEARPWRPALLGWLAGATVLYAAAWMGVTQLLAGERTMANLILSHGGLVGCVALLAVGCFGPFNLRKLYGTYRRECALTVAIAAAFYGFLLAVYALWRPLASAALHSAKFLLGLSGVHSQIVPPYTLLFDKFGVTIAQACSGIESIALFSGLYAVVGLLDWQRLNIRRYILVFPVALALLFGLNILRVYLLILAGYFINPEIAFSLFHTYAGMVFFILYSALFWAVAYKYLLHKQDR